MNKLFLINNILSTGKFNLYKNAKRLGKKNGN